MKNQKEQADDTRTSFARRRKMGKRILLWLGTLILQVALVPVQAAAGTNAYILRSPSAAQAQAACQRYGLQIVRNLGDKGVYLVQGSDAVPPDLLKQWVKGDPDVKNLELDDDSQIPERSLVNYPAPTAPPATAPVTDLTLVKLYGAGTWVGYVQQPAMSLINATTVQQRHITGTGIVAIIDTGVDPRHPVLSSVLLPGYDFTRDVMGSASEFADLSQSTAAILEQSTAAILEQTRIVQLNQSTAAILEQSTAAILEGQKLPAYFGHGTMVAGLVHLVAPTAQIMPLKAFKADGSAKISDIARAIYYATNQGAKVINMSFGLPRFSDEVMRAVNYANRKGVICIAAVGNEAKPDLVYPAAMGNVAGVGSTTFNDQRSAFSNYGADLVTVAAPGEALVTTYPGKHYAQVWGTSFSSALVSGGSALLVGAVTQNTSVSLEQADVRRALAQAVPCGTCDLGNGRVDLYAAVQYIRQVKLPQTSTAPK